MTVIGPQVLLATFLIFCRIGTCLMLMPGFSSPRVPVRVRLFLAVAVTLALAPLLVTNVQAATPGDSPVVCLRCVRNNARERSRGR